MISIIAVALLVILLPPVVYDVVRSPTIRRLGLRNVSRRRGEAALVVGGSMLATALIAASLIVGTSFDQSIRELAGTRWGPVDEIVVVDDQLEAQRVVAELQAVDSDLLDGLLPALSTQLAVGSVGDGRSVEPTAHLLEVDLEAARTFGSDASTTGLEALLTAAPDTVVVSESLADSLGVTVGESIDVHVGADTQRLIVTDVVAASGLTSWADVIVPAGAFSNGPAIMNVELADIASSVVLVSNAGGVFEGVELTTDVESLLAATLSNHTFEVERVKQDILRDAEAEGSEMTELFGTIGGFSVIAGILLVINLFVMLAGERNVELGTLRAVGVKRGHVLRAFALEGAVYGVLAAVVGALLGVAVAAAVMAFAAYLFGESDGVAISLAVEPRDLLVGAVIGLSISQLTVVLTSFRMTRINIVRALRDLPAQAKIRSRRVRLLSGVIGVGSGAALYVFAGSNPIGAMLGPVIVAVGAIPLLGMVLAPRLATVIGCGVALVWPAAVFGLLPDVMDDPDIAVFLLQGVLLVGLATAIFAALDGVWLRLADRLSGNGLSTRLGLANPLARPVRSALLVAMYGLVIFTVTFMAIMNQTFQASAPQLAAHAGGSYEIVIDSNRVGPLDVSIIEAHEGVDGVASVRRGFFDLRAEPGSDGIVERWVGSAISDDWDPSLAPSAPIIDATFASEADLWAAVAGSTVVDGAQWVVLPDDASFVLGQSIEMVAADGATQTVKVGGFTRNNWLVGSGMYFSDSISRSLFGSAGDAERHYVNVAEGFDAAAIAASLTAESPERGVDARTFLTVAQSELDGQEGFLTMLQGYLGLGLLIGIAGLSVVLVRAVRERRRELGMLKAIGVPTSQTQLAFLVEAGFIGLQGVVLGIGLGLLSAWQVLTRSSAFEEDLQFAAPAAWLAGLAALALTASLLAAVGPARRAGRTPPAVALRITG